MKTLFYLRHQQAKKYFRGAFDVHVPPFVTVLTVSSEFLEPGAEYELEVLALEVSGNQTISIVHFATQ